MSDKNVRKNKEDPGKCIAMLIDTSNMRVNREFAADHLMLRIPEDFKEGRIPCFSFAFFSNLYSQSNLRGEDG